MNVKNVKSKVANIEKIKRDFESAHVEEDRLWHEVLEAIAKGTDNAQALAVEALKTNDISFVRQYA